MTIDEYFEKYDEAVHRAGINAMPPDVLHGYVSALACSPTEDLPDNWLAPVFPEGFAVPEDLEAILLELTEENTDAIDEGELVCLMRWHEDDKGREVPDAAAWCSGFIKGIAVFAGEPFASDTKLAMLLEPMRFLAGDTTGISEIKLKTLEAMKHEFLEQVEYLVMEVWWHVRELYYGEDPDLLDEEE